MTGDAITGVMLIKNQANTARMALESVAHVVEQFHLIDNMSRDRTRDVLESTVEDLGIPATIESRPGDAGDLMAELINDRVETRWALRVEGDQVHHPDRLVEILDHLKRGRTLCYQSRLIQNRLDLQNKHYPINPPHPLVYDAELGVRRRPGMIWPRQSNRKVTTLERVVNVNVRVQRPILRLMRWHRTGGYGRNGKWWNRPPTREEIPDLFTVPEVQAPYQEHFTMREYMRLLRERGKGSIQWEGDTFAEVAEEFMEWDTAENTEPYEGEYPPLLAEWIDEHGVTGFEEWCPL